ncbi:hypothetical protein LINPERHAP2_LOCUS21467 [Linum perenne]
METKVL